jgi:sodium-dependent dicarboxylate transporter 2/3/5
MENIQAFRKKGFWLGIFLFFTILLLPSPSELSSEGWIVAAIVILMAIWWATEAIPVPVTALLPLALFPYGYSFFKEAAATLC